MTNKNQTSPEELRVNSGLSLLDSLFIDAIEIDFKQELAEIQAESIGWLQLEHGAYLHLSDANATEVVVVGQPQFGGAVLLIE